MAKIISPDRFSGGEWIASNSLDATFGTLLTIKSGYIDNAVAGDKIEWLSAETKVFEANNQTVKKEKLQYIRIKDETELEITVGTGTISQANVWAKFDLGSDNTVNATAATPSQLTLRKVISSTKGIFVKSK